VSITLHIRYILEPLSRPVELTLADSGPLNGDCQLTLNQIVSHICEMITSLRVLTHGNWLLFPLVSTLCQ